MRHIRPFRLLLLTSSLALFHPAGPVQAQEVDSASAIGWLRQLCPGEQVMVSTTLRERVMGRCTALEDERLVLRQERGERTLPLASVDSVWRRAPAGRSATLTGAAIGGAVASALAMLYVAAFCDYDCRSDYLKAGVAGGLTGAFSGAVAGGLLASGRSVWVRVSP